MINHSLVVFIQHDPDELKGLSSWTFAEFDGSGQELKKAQEFKIE
jgi:hypothetical protein